MVLLSFQDIDRKFQAMRLPATSDNVNRNSGSATSPAGGEDGTNITFNPVKILKRPTGTSTTPSTALLPSPESQPKGVTGPQILLEDNTRTQYVPQVRILKRPNGPNGKGGSSADSRGGNSRGQASTKTLEEREAEYAKARLRILGSSTPQDSSSPTEPATTFSPGSSKTSSPTNSAKQNGINSGSNSLSNAPKCDVPVVRQPQGPTEGSKGFNQPHFHPQQR